MRKLQFEVATKIKTVDDLELTCKDMEYRLATMEAIKEAQKGVIEPRVWKMKVTGDFQPDVKDKECQLELLQDVEAGLGDIGVKLKKAISIANMQGKRRISNRRSSLLEMAASIKKASELLGEEASI